MKDSPPRVTASEAIASIRKWTEDGVRIHGLDGFTVIPEGFRADLDLLLDVSKSSMGATEAAAKAEAFVKENARPDVVWEVWVDEDE